MTACSGTPVLLQSKEKPASFPSEGSHVMQQRPSCNSPVTVSGLLHMRSLWLRCLVILLSLALVSGNAHAALQLGAAHHEPCPERLDHHAGTNSLPDRHHHKAAGAACCCDCIGCASAVNLTPDLTGFAPVFFAGTIRYGDENSILAGRALLPEPDPPRPSALT